MRAKILIVDDEPNLLRLLEYNLNEKFEVILKNDGAEALQWLHEGNIPNLVVTDVTMRAMDGSELLENIRKDPGLDKVPVIFLTAKSPCVDAIHTLIDAADDYIVKPFDIEELITSIENFLPTAV
ncbi:response regulator [candidate division KSB1 bacterium]|nr:response regulator [candidate division KSB1 bacterium]